MNTAIAKPKLVRFPRNKILSVVRTVLPKGSQFDLQVLNSRIGRMKIVRVVTPAWRNLPPSVRILRLLRVANRTLSESERKDILRFSVLTPRELQMLTQQPVKKIAVKTKNAAMSTAA